VDIAHAASILIEVIIEPFEDGGQLCVLGKNSREIRRRGVTLRGRV